MGRNTGAEKWNKFLTVLFVVFMGDKTGSLKSLNTAFSPRTDHASGTEPSSWYNREDEMKSSSSASIPLLSKPTIPEWASTICSDFVKKLENILKFLYSFSTLASFPIQRKNVKEKKSIIQA